MRCKLCGNKLTLEYQLNDHVLYWDLICINEDGHHFKIACNKYLDGSRTVAYP